MEHAAGLFAERGYHPTSVADIVESLGVGKGVFYWYFSSKEELLVEILRESHQDLRRRQQAAIGDEPDPVLRIELGIRASIAVVPRAPQVLHAVPVRRQRRALRARAAPQPRRRDRRRGHGTSRTAIVEGRIADQDPEVLAEAVVGVVRRS